MQRLLIFVGLVAGLVAVACSPNVEARFPRGGGVPSGYRPVQIGAGGFVTGIDQANDGTMVVMTDTDGALRWDGNQNKWVQMVTSATMPGTDSGPFYFSGSYSVAVAPSNSNRMYLLMGSGNLFVSNDKGASWTLTSFPQAPWPNSDPNDGGFRNMNRNMAIDPVNPDVVYAGVGGHGLYLSTNGGTSWTKISSAQVPDIAASGGYWPRYLIAFDPSSSSGGNTNTVYVGSYGNGVYKTTNRTTFTLAASSGPSNPFNMIVAPDGKVYVIDGTASAIYRLSAGAWATKNTAVVSYNNWLSIAADPNTAGRLIVASPRGGATTTDYGDNWTLIPPTSWGSACAGGNASQITSATGDATWLAWTDGCYMSFGNIIFDKTVANKVWMAEGLGVLYTTWTGSPTSAQTWNFQSRGIENLVANRVVSPQGGVPLTCSWDRPIHYISNPEVYPSTNKPRADFNACWDLEFAPGTSAVVALINFPGYGNQSSISTDGGVNWSLLPTQPPNIVANGNWDGGIAVSTASNFMIAPNDNGQPEYTTNGGASWTTAPVGVTVVSGETGFGFYYRASQHRKIVTADQVTPNKFYIYNYGPSDNVNNQAGVYVSTNSGASWTRGYASAFPNSGHNALLKAVPYNAGHLFFTSGPNQPSTGTGSFYYSTDSGSNFSAVGSGATLVTEVWAFGLGAIKSGNDYPSVYIAGYYNGVLGIYRSDSSKAAWAANTQTFTPVGTYPPNGNFDIITTVEGDANTWSKFYIGFQGSGYAYYNP